MRVAPEEEFEGLDVGEHGMSAYPDFATHPSSFGGVGTGMAQAAAPAVSRLVTVKS